MKPIEEQLRELVQFIQGKRIYILSEFESGGRELIALADKSSALLAAQAPAEKVSDEKFVRSRAAGPPFAQSWED